MSLRVSGLTKIYGSQRAVDNISFEAPKGKITGFLGPNGAGKSTTMKIATGFARPTNGTILLNGLDVTEQSLAVKKITGYLPENNPLYLEMYVREFLIFVARAYRIKQIKSRVEEVIGLFGLTRESNKRIKELSKGYRQRVGLAQAMIHDPEILILDEPTTGLDPNQILEIREVIRKVSQDKTVILSTHIMQEVEAICDKVVIIDQGQIVADDDVAVLRSGQSAQEAFTVVFESPVDAALFEGFSLEKNSDTQCVITSESPNLRSEILKIISINDLPLVSISKNADRSLEEVFRSLTRKEADV